MSKSFNTENSEVHRGNPSEFPPGAVINLFYLTEEQRREF